MNYVIRSSIPDLLPSLHFRGFDRVNLRQVSGDAIPFLSFVGASPDFAAGRAEINTGRIAFVSGHRLSKDCEPCLFGGQSFILSLPGLSAVARNVCGRLASGRSARPNLSPIHRKDPDSIGIARVQDHWESDVADRF